MTQYLLSLHTLEGEPREPTSEDATREFMRRIGELEEEMRSADALVYSGRLSDVDQAAVVRVEDGKTVTTDGPFTETKEHLGGFYLVNANDMDEALSWAAKTAACVGRAIEVRPFVGLRGD